MVSLERQPQIARRFGDRAECSLKEFSEGAYAYVRDELGWFYDIRQENLQLDNEGHLQSLEASSTPESVSSELLLGAARPTESFST